MKCSRFSKSEQTENGVHAFLMTEKFVWNQPFWPTAVFETQKDGPLLYPSDIKILDCFNLGHNSLNLCQLSSGGEFMFHCYTELNPNLSNRMEKNF